jgi:hypothetical protein
MSSGLIIVIAISTAAAIILLALLLTKVVHAVADSASGLAPDLSRLRRRLTHRFSRARSTGPPVRKEAARPATGEPRGSAGGQRAGPAEEPAVAGAEEPAVPSGAASPIPLAQEPALRVGEPAGPARAEPPLRPAERLLAPHVPTGRSVDVKPFRRSKFEQSERGVGDEPGLAPAPDGSAEGGSAGYRQVGEEVTAVLTTAEHVAEQIRETAVQEAEQTRLAAEEQAAATLAEAEARRVDADSYGEATRAAADAYAEETRRSTDEEAARTVSEAEERARLIRAEAEQKASDIEAEAIRRRDALTTSTEGMQDRIESMLSAFRRATSELEELLPAERRSGEEERERLDEALKPSSSRDELSSHTEQ